MKKILSAALSLAMLISLCACGSSSSSGTASSGAASSGAASSEAVEPVELVMTSGATTEHIISKFGAEIMENVEAATNGAVTIKYYPGDSMGASGERIDMLANGDIDIDIQALSAFDSYNPRQGIMSAFFMFESWDHYRAVTESDTYKEIIAGLEDALDITDLGDVYYAKRNILSSVPVNSIEDLQGLKFRVPNEAMPIAGVGALGAAPTPMSGNEVYSSLQNNTIQATENGAEQIVTSAFYEVAPYMAVTAHQYQTMHLLMSNSTRDKLTDEQFEIICNVIDEAVEKYDVLAQESEAEKEQFLRDNITVNDTIDLEPFYDALEAMYEEYDDVWGDGTWEAFKALA